MGVWTTKTKPKLRLWRGKLRFWWRPMGCGAKWATSSRRLYTCSPSAFNNGGVRGLNLGGVCPPFSPPNLQVQPLGVWRAGSRDIVTGWGTKCHHPLLPWQWQGLTVEDGGLLAGPGPGSGGGERGAEVAPGGLAVAHRLEVMAGSPTASITPHPSSSTPPPSQRPHRHILVTASRMPAGMVVRSLVVHGCCLVARPWDTDSL